MTALSFLDQVLEDGIVIPADGLSKNTFSYRKTARARRPTLVLYTDSESESLCMYKKEELSGIYAAD